jgi:amphi-Trp domain-containing protein
MPVVQRSHIMAMNSRGRYSDSLASPLPGIPTGRRVMSDVKLERKESVSRDEAAEWLSLLSRAFTQGGHVELPFGAGTVSLHIPNHVRAEFEVEVDSDEVEVEVEFKWSTAHTDAAPTEDGAAAQTDAAERKPTRSAKSKRG